MGSILYVMNTKADIPTRRPQHKKIAHVPFYLQIVDHLKRQIEGGTLKVNDCLPTEMELMASWSVSRQTVRNALAELETDGYIHRIAGKGTFVSGKDAATDALRRQQAERRPQRNGGNHAVGLLIPCVTISLYTGIVRGAEDAAYAAGYHLVIGNYDVNPDKEEEYLNLFLERHLSGVIAAPSFNSRSAPYQRLLAAGIPLTLTDILLPEISTDLVCTDNIEGGRLAADHLISKGCKRLGFICGGIDTSSAQERILGYQLALKRARLPAPETRILGGSFDVESGYRLGLQLQQEGVDGIVVANENLTLGVMRALKDRETAVQVVSFDEPSIPRSLPCPVALVTQPRYEIGKTAAELLLQRLRGSKGRTESETEVFRKICLTPRVVSLAKEDAKAVAA